MTNVISFISQLFLLDNNEVKWRANGDICFKKVKCSPVKDNFMSSVEFQNRYQQYLKLCSYLLMVPKSVVCESQYELKFSQDQLI